ncbi:MAG: sulfatase-like hydrolase/transferase [Planctomycetes bacterium]|nr:sulfatase-like hydrolase/transferase [Planctomycetota bacterium]
MSTTFLHVAGILALSLAAEPDRRPNIVLILADDLGYGELGCYGGREIPTPSIDSLASNGVRFAAGYVSCPVCSPTRAGLLTGRYQQRFGHEFNPGQAAIPPGVRFGLPLPQRTLADRLRAAGYRTGMVGKWHLGNDPAYHPLRRGFEEYFGFLGGAHAYLPARERAKARKRQAKAQAQAQANAVLRGTEPVEEKEYLTDALTREAVAFIRRRAKEPFFLYLSYNAVHAPLEAPPRHTERFRGIPEGKRRTFAAMLSALDDGVGAVLRALREERIEEDTLVFFLSDNGGPTPSTTSANGPLRGHKSQVFEGGLRVPFLVQWKGKVPGGRTSDEPVSALDLLPTALAAAGAPLAAGEETDGVDLLPHLTWAQARIAREHLFWRFGPQAAVRKGRWKLLRQRGGDWQLYDLSADLGESKDLAGARPELVTELGAAFERWDAQLAKPLWGPAAAGRRLRL